MLPLDVYGYLIQFLRIDVAAKLSSVCKDFSGKFVWQHILEFENGSYASQKLANKVTEQLLKHSLDLIRFESIFITEIGDEFDLNELIRRVTPQLRRFGRNIYTLRIVDEELLLESLKPRNVERLEIQAIDSVRVEKIFKSNNFPKLTHLAVSQDEVDEYMDEPPTVASIRPMLENIASATGNLEVFEVIVSNLVDDKGSLIDAIRGVALANKRSLKILDFAPGGDARGPNATPELFLTPQWFGEILHGAVSDPSRWHMLPDMIQSTFGVHLSSFRSLGATVWQLMFTSFRIGHTELVPLEHVRNLFDAVYPRGKTSIESRAQSFEIFLVDATWRTLKSFKENNTTLRAQYASWMVSEISNTLQGVDLRSLHLDRVLLGLFGVMSFHDACELPQDDVWQQVNSVASILNPEQPLIACYELLDGKFGFHGDIDSSMLPELIAKRCKREEIDFLSPAGQSGDPLIIYLRDKRSDAFGAIVSDQELFDPLRMHPTRQVPMLLFILLEPGRSQGFDSSSSSLYDVVSVVSNLFEKHQSALEAIEEYSPIEHVTRFLERRSGLPSNSQKLMKWIKKLNPPTTHST